MRVEVGKHYRVRDDALYPTHRRHLVHVLAARLTSVRKGAKTKLQSIAIYCEDCRKQFELRPSQVDRLEPAE